MWGSQGLGVQLSTYLGNCSQGLVLEVPRGVFFFLIVVLIYAFPSFIPLMTLKVQCADIMGREEALIFFLKTKASVYMCSCLYVCMCT